MKMSEWLTWITTLILVCGGFALCKRGMMVPGIATCLASFTLSGGYVYLVKIRPIAMARETFLRVATDQGFESLPEKRWRKGIARVLRAFPGFGDMYLGVENVHGMENDSGTYFVGNYSLSGNGLNFGYFMIAELRSSGLRGVTLDKVQDQGGDFEFEEELALSEMPSRVQQTLRQFPYDFHFRGHLLMVDFDARYLREDNFSESFNEMVDAMSTLVDR